MRRHSKLLLLGLLSLAPLHPAVAQENAGGKAESQKPDEAGKLLSAQLIGQLSAAQLTKKFSEIGLQARNGVKIFRVSYLSDVPNGESRPASGLVLVPDVKAPVYPWISLQHGTTAAKADAPSLSPGEGLVEASQGFVTAVADYLGYGESADLYHPYIIEEAYADSNVAMLRAARQLAENQGWNLGPLFLKGYSEGGYATLALQKAIEQNYADEFPIIASAPAAGPYDPLATGKILVEKADVNPVNVPFLILSYNKWLGKGEGLDLTKIFQPSLVQVENALSGNYDNEEVKKLIPTKNDELFQPEFLADFSGKMKTDDAKTLEGWLKEQSLLNDKWVPTTPTRLYHCIDDDQVPAVNTELAAAHFKGLDDKAPVTEVLVPSPDAEHPYTHTTCPAVFSSLQWFGEILAAAAPAPAPSPR